MARNRSARPEAKALRLFVAVDVPQAVKDRLSEVVAAFRERLPGARWTSPGSWHLTLKFLGATWPRLVSTVHDAVAVVAAGRPAFQTRVGPLGAFPSPGRARVLWAGLEDPEGLIVALARDLDSALARHFPVEQRPFTPHLTLARLNPPRDLRSAAPELPGFPVASEPFPVESLVLYRSHLSPRGAIYEALERFSLRGPGA